MPYWWPTRRLIDAGIIISRAAQVWVAYRVSGLKATESAAPSRAGSTAAVRRSLQNRSGAAMLQPHAPGYDHWPGARGGARRSDFLLIGTGMRAPWLRQRRGALRM